MSQPIKAFLIENIHTLAAELLLERGIAVNSSNCALIPDKLNKQLSGCQLLGIRSRTTIDSSVFKDHTDLLAIGIFGIGSNQVDLRSCQMAGVAVFNAPYSNTRSVVELTLGNIIMLARRVFDHSSQLHYGIWNKTADRCFELRGKTLGIIGYGNIGSQLSILAEAMGMQICYYDIVEKLPLGNAFKCKSLDELLTKADIVTVHVDGRQENINLISTRQFKTMKSGTLFLNLSRGFVVNYRSLASALRTGKLGGAAVDVYPQEPTRNGSGFKSLLQNLPNTILTPHIGASTIEAQQNIARFMVDKILNFLQTGDTTLSLNFPQLQLPQSNSYYRFSHVHLNVPGRLAAINTILARSKLNIEGQYLKTNEHIGYVVTDVNRPLDSRIIKELKNISHTIKVRVICGDKINPMESLKQK